MIFTRRLLLLGASWAASFVSDRSMLMKDSAEQLYVDALSGSEAIATRLWVIREWRPLNRERRRSALSLGGTGHGMALTQTTPGQTLPVMILQNAVWVIDNAKKGVISHQK